MRVTIDLERDIIIIPDNFFKKIKEDNERLKQLLYLVSKESSIPLLLLYLI